MRRPTPIKFPLKIAADRDPDGHVRVVDANNAMFIRVVAGDLEMLKVIVSEVNAKAKKLN